MLLNNIFNLKRGTPILMPNAFDSLLRATAQPSLLDRTMTGLSFKLGSKTLSHETYILLTSMRKRLYSHVS